MSPAASDVYALAGLLVAVHALSAARLILRWTAGRTPDRGRPQPPVTVVIPCKGPLPGGGRALRGFLEQRYEGPREYVFVFASKDDPGIAQLTFALDGVPARWKTTVSGAVPTVCSEQNLNLVFGVKQASAGSEVLAFTDTDVVAGPDWLASLVSPLAEPSCGAATAAALPVPPTLGSADLLKCAWILYGLPHLTGLGYAIGHSLAMRRADFERLHVAESWSRAANMDLVAGTAVRLAGLKVVYAPAQPFDPYPAAMAPLQAGFTRWLLHFRWYGPLIWHLGFSVTAAKLFIWAWSLGHAMEPALLLVGGDALVLVVTALSASWAAPEAYRSAPMGFWAVLAVYAPLLPFLFAANYAQALVSPVMRWSGWRYRLRGPFDVQAEQG